MDSRLATLLVVFCAGSFGLSAKAQTELPPAELRADTIVRASRAENLYGGPTETHFRFRLSTPGELFKVLEVEGPYARIVPPGDLVVYVAERGAGREYLTSNGRDLAHIVQASDLYIRGEPDAGEAAAPPLGKLQANDGVIVLDKLPGDWVRVAVPPALTDCWIKTEAIVALDDQAAGTESWQTAWLAARDEVIRRGAISGPILARLSQDAALVERTQKATAAFEAEVQKPLAARNSEAIEGELSELRDRWPEGSAERQRIDRMLEVSGQWVEAQREVKALDAQLAERARAAEELERRHREDLERVTKEATEKIASEKLPAKRGTFLYSGWVRRVDKVRGLDRASPDHYLEVAGQRAAYLECSRYDLADFEGQLVGIWTLEIPERVRPGDTVKTLRIRRMEIVHSKR